LFRSFGPETAKSPEVTSGPVFFEKDRNLKKFVHTRKTSPYLFRFDS
jgi:hypothetical protein